MGTPYLVKRRASWYVRSRIPADLRPGIGEHVVRSLHTSDLATARRRALHVAAGMGSVWHEVGGEIVTALGKNIEALPPEGRVRPKQRIDELVGNVGQPDARGGPLAG